MTASPLTAPLGADLVWVPDAGPASATRTPDPSRWLALALLALADFVVILDATIVNIALPSIGRELHASTADLSWVVSAYVLAFGGLLLLGGRLADLFGRRRLFIAGLIVFGFASLAGGLSTSIGALIAFRAVQGAGAAAAAPAARSLLTTLFAEGPERSKALGIWAAVAGSGSVVGLILGGVLTSTLSWQWVLFINVPVTLAAAALAPALIRESRAAGPDRSLDLLGAVLVTGGLLAGLYALVNANTAGWGSLQTTGLLTASAGLFAAFIWVENATSAPLVPLRIFRIGDVRGANVAMLAMTAAMVGMFFIFTLYQQQLQGYSALKSGVSQLPLGLVLIVVAALAGPVTEKVGTKPVLLTGLGLFTAGVAWLSRLPLHASYLTDILGPNLIIGIGLGLTFVALTIASVRGVPTAQTGIASGMINMTQQVGGAIGLAVLTAVSDSHTHTLTNPASLDAGFRAALLVATAIAGLAALSAAIVLPGRTRTTACRDDDEIGAAPTPAATAA